MPQIKDHYSPVSAVGRNIENATVGVQRAGNVSQPVVIANPHSLDAATKTVPEARIEDGRPRRNTATVEEDSILCWQMVSSPALKSTPAFAAKVYPPETLDAILAPPGSTNFAFSKPPSVPTTTAAETAVSPLNSPMVPLESKTSLANDVPAVLQRVEQRSVQSHANQMEARLTF